MFFISSAYLALETATQMKNKGRVCSNVVPIKERNMVRKMDATG